MHNNEKILTITYFYATKGCCPAEWADDKVDSMCKLDKKIILLTSIFSRKNMNKNVIHYRIPSLSIPDFRHELNELKNDEMKIPYIKLLFFIPFILTIGLGLDLLQKILTSGNGGGKWSWMFPASVAALYLVLRYNCEKIFTTGGPASAHLAGVFVKLLTRKELICELQDPLTGKDIGRTVNSAKMLNIVEKIMMSNANKVVFVTKNASELAKRKYCNLQVNIVAIYPGSRFYYKSQSNNHELKKLKLIHLGTLYSTRNLNTLIKAIDELIKENIINENQIEILNLGEIYGEIKKHHLSRPYIKQESIKPRKEAISIASEFDISLLIQHADSRSESTIPYKTYDYINIGNPILALTNSDELTELLSSHGHLAINVNNIVMIKNTLLNLLTHYSEYKENISPLAIDIVKQTKKILEK